MDECRGPLVTVVGTPDAAADISLAVGSDGIRVRDARGELQAIAGCRQVDEHEALCPPNAPYAQAEVQTSDREDRVVLTGVAARVHAGGGNDVVLGSFGDDLFDGGAGADLLDPGAGINEVRIADELDRVDGTRGYDRVSFADASGPVTVDLATGTVDGAPRLTRVEAVLGSRGDDRLLGSDRSDEVLDGHDGRDVIRGRGGADILVSGYGSDRLFGGPGDDLLIADGRTCPSRRTEAQSASCAREDTARDVLDCGPGRTDRVERVRRGDTAIGGCERAVLLGSRFVLHRLAGGDLRLFVPRCVCRAVTISVRDRAGRLLARRRERIRSRPELVTLRGLRRDRLTVVVKAGTRVGGLTWRR